ncbi:phospholipid/cholesterol/gamma-HCH transport system substrate-binding protein [Marmoricola sp. OAE513]|uniref:MCE family protein n=1 Tax=Marmoricola sp. OAE513 TaxID=2817894 RepID=UPI001DD3C144
MTPRYAVRLVVLAVAAVLLSSCRFDGAYDLPLPGGKAVDPDDAITVTAEFTDALNVVPRTAVMVDDVPVGQVSEVERVGWHARITLQVRRDLDLPANTEADIRQTSLLGEKYVALLEPATKPSGRLRTGDNIPLSRTGKNPEVEEVLGALSGVLSGGGIEQIKTISVEVNTMLNGRTEDARGALANITRLVGSLDDQKGSIVAAMAAVDRLVRTLNKERTTFGAAIDAVGPALEVLSGQQDQLTRMLVQLDRLGAVGTRVLRASKADLLATLRHLAPALRELADAGDSLPRGISILASFPFPKEAADLAMGDYANALFRMDFDLAKLLGTGGSSGLPNLANLCASAPLNLLCPRTQATPGFAGLLRGGPR